MTSMITFENKPLLDRVAQYIAMISPSVAEISEDRKILLDQVVDYILEKDGEVRLNFICTHNSRRSHFGQVWATTMARYHGISRIKTFSGGTEATAFNPRSVSALERAGFEIKNPGGSNPKYELKYSAHIEPIVSFSKTFDDPSNPEKDFAAIMTCSEADQECPFIPGAESRIRLLYEDPKVADDSDEEKSKYDERCRQIAIEMYYVMDQATQ